jgi:uncharacterized membrane protein
MTPQRLTLLVAMLLVGLSAGFFFTYEASVTLGLAQLGDVAYVQAFQAINDTVRNPAFGLVFFGSVPALAVAVAANRGSTSPMQRGLLAAALPLYLVGLMITGVGNVSLNEELAEYGELTPVVAAEARADFEGDWNRLNLLRAIAIGSSFAALAGASILAPPSGVELNDRRSIGETASL